MAHHPKRFLEHYSDFSLDTHVFHIYQCSSGSISRVAERFSEDDEQAVKSHFAKVQELIAGLEEILQQEGFTHYGGIQEFDEVAKQDDMPIRI